ncbi:Calcium homeostasis endoplasmic reticulum protein-like 2 [Homarus americanus]|uniref:Calcium homeostasis endoplasmic reticulum protein-like 2 n=4 Tax=Homarus americanus TaxID=6706 RepID=A0A8J5K2F6_HOMAM|nr:Calcium homeostasis endoplasmic reticulum protein-like 2 [Homarus americanus]
MAPLVKMEDHKYRPLDQNELRLPPPTPPSDRLLRAVENFYAPPSHEKPRNSEGWEQLALYDYYKEKSQSVKRIEKEISEGIRERSRSPSPVVIEPPPEEEERPSDQPARRYRSESPEKIEEKKKSHSRSRSRSPSPIRRSLSRQRSRTRSPSCSPPPRSHRRSLSKSPRRSSSRSPRRSSRSRSRSRSESPGTSPPRVPFNRSPSRSPTPPSFMGGSFSKMDQRLDESNKGHQMLRKMGWGGSGLGVKEQGISDPVAAAEVRDTPQDRFRGLGVPSAQTDPYEAFRKNKGQAFINRMKARAEEKF